MIKSAALDRACRAGLVDLPAASTGSNNLAATECPELSYRRHMTQSSTLTKASLTGPILAAVSQAAASTDEDIDGLIYGELHCLGTSPQLQASSPADLWTLGAQGHTGNVSREVWETSEVRSILAECSDRICLYVEDQVFLSQSCYVLPGVWSRRPQHAACTSI